MKKFALSFAVLVAVVGLASSHLFAQSVTAPGDPITGIWSTTVGGNSTASTVGTGAAGQYPAGEPPTAAIDGPITTKYLNFGTGGGGGLSAITKGVGTGYYVTPALGLSLVTGIQVATANDSPARDPLSVSLEGSNATGADLALGSSWTPIQSDINLGIDIDPGRLMLAPAVSFTNTTPYTSYRVLVQSQRASANSTQYGELNLLGVAVPEPSTVALAGMGLIGLVVAVRRRRK